MCGQGQDKAGGTDLLLQQGVWEERGAHTEPAYGGPRTSQPV